MYNIIQNNVLYFYSKEEKVPENTYLKKMNEAGFENKNI